MFQPRFAELVRSGEKTQTIRTRPKRMPEPGDIIDCRQWEGRPYGSPQVKLGEHEITGVFTLALTDSVIGINGAVWNLATDARSGFDGFARQDGFEDWADMVRWFRETHDLPFSGILIDWKPNEPTA